AASLRNAGITTVNTNAIIGLTTPGSTFDASWTTSNPVAWGFDAGGWIYRETSGDPVFDPATLGGNGTTIPAATAVATYAPAGGSPLSGRPPASRAAAATRNAIDRPPLLHQPYELRPRYCERRRKRRLSLLWRSSFAPDRVGDQGRRRRSRRSASAGERLAPH